MEKTKPQPGLIEKIKVLVQISRPINILMIALGILVTFFAVLGLKKPPMQLTFFAILAAALIAAGGNAINDYYDINIDKINRPDRPLPSKKISARGVWAYAIILFGLGIMFSILINVYTFILATLNSFLLGIYAFKVKRLGFLGDIVISYLVASVFVFAALAVKSLKLGLILAIAAFFTNAAREILKDLEDVEGDRAFGIKTLPILWGKKRTIFMVWAFLLISVLVSPLPYALDILSFYYMIFAVAADVVFIFVIYSLYKKSDMKSISANQARIKIGALIGLFAFLAGTIPF